MSLSMRRKWWSVGRAAFVFAVLLIGAAANAQLRIEIRSGVERPIPMAIVPFGFNGGGAAAPFDLAGLVTADLGNSGRFDPIPESDMLSRPTQPADINFNDWQILDVDVVLIGELTEDAPDRYTIVFQLFDVLRGEQLLGFRLSTSLADLRAAGHQIADIVYEELTGIPGVFSTSIAYVNETRNPDGSQRFRLIVADSDGENSRAIADSPDPLMSPAWSPDGRRIAYVSFEGENSAVYVQTLRTGTRDRVSSREGVNSAPAFSPDGRRLALTLSRDGNLDIYTIDLATQVLRRLTQSSSIDTEPTWSEDGESIYFTSDRAGGPQIYRIPSVPPVDRAERVTFEGSYNARPRVSPDGGLVGGRAPQSGQLSNRYRRPGDGAGSGADERPTRRITELRAEWCADHLCDARRRAGRAGVGQFRRAYPPPDRLGGGRRARAGLVAVSATLTSLYVGWLDDYRSDPVF